MNANPPDSTLPTVHRRPNESCLEPFRQQIAERRRLCWPYRRLAVWLADEHDLSISWPSIRSFCEVRQIRKGTGEVRSSDQSATRSSPSKPKRWNFNTDSPLETQQP